MTDWTQLGANVAAVFGAAAMALVALNSAVVRVKKSFNSELIQEVSKLKKLIASCESDKQDKEVEIARQDERLKAGEKELVAHRKRIEALEAAAMKSKLGRRKKDRDEGDRREIK